MTCKVVQASCGFFFFVGFLSLLVLHPHKGCNPHTGLTVMSPSQGRWQMPLCPKGMGRAIPQALGGTGSCPY